MVRKSLIVAALWSLWSGAAWSASATHLISRVAWSWAPATPLAATAAILQLPYLLTAIDAAGKLYFNCSVAASPLDSPKNVIVWRAAIDGTFTGVAGAGVSAFAIAGGLAARSPFLRVCALTLDAAGTLDIADCGAAVSGAGGDAGANVSSTTGPLITTQDSM